MRKLALLILSCTLVTGQFLASAQSPDSKSKSAVVEIPAVVSAGLEAYKAKGPEDAVKTWIKGSPIDGSKEAMSQANNLRQVQDFYGEFQGYELVGIRQITPKTKVVYMVLDYEKGPLFAKFVVYQTGNGWILTNFIFNTKEDAILPPQLN